MVGAGSSAFDAAGVALEAGAAQVHLFSRRAYIDYQAPAPQAPPPQAPLPPVDRGYPNVLELTYELPDVVRWRNFIARRPPCRVGAARFAATRGGVQRLSISI